MLNRKLFNSKRDAEIARLKMAIAKFKEYDQERKQYYADKMQRLGELESWYEEMKSNGDELNQLKIKVAEQKEEIKRMRRSIELYKVRTDMDEDELRESITIENLKRENKNLRDRSKAMKETLNNLILKLSKLERHESLDE